MSCPSRVGRSWWSSPPRASPCAWRATGRRSCVSPPTTPGRSTPGPTSSSGWPRGDLDPVEDFALRLDALHLAERREADGLGSFLGGRIRLFPHQLHAAERAAAADPVRWLLADEVGLGKTIEACLVLSRLVRTGRAERCLVVAPETLTVQWLGELFRKYHQVFVLLDDARLADVARDHGPDFNPFDVHRRAVIALETLVARPELTARAVEAGIDLLVVDEAHRLRRPPGHPGSPAWRAVAPIAGLGRHLLLLTAIPLDDDVHGFFRLLQMLRPADFPEDETFEARLSRPEPLPPCTSSTRRVDIGGLPPRVGRRGRETRRAGARGWPSSRPCAPPPRPTPSAGGRRRTGCAAPSPRGPPSRPSSGATTGRSRASPGRPTRPTLAWRGSPGRPRAGATPGRRRSCSSPTARRSSGCAPSSAAAPSSRPASSTRASRPRAATSRSRSSAWPRARASSSRPSAGARAGTSSSAAASSSSTCPGTRSSSSSAIGRLDRIGRRLPVEVVHFVPPDGIGRDAARLFEALGLFREPLAGLEPELARVEAALEMAALSPSGTLSPARFDAIVEGARAAQSRIREAAWREMHRDPYRKEMADAILARVPPDLDALNEDVVTAACERLFLHVEPHAGHVFSVELGNQALVDSLPGVPGGTSFLGTFDREEAVADERLDFFASGHPLVEGVLAHLEESPLGRVAVLRVGMGTEKGLGLLALYKEGPTFDAVAVDAAGRPRPDWAAALRRRPLRTRRLASGPAARHRLAGRDPTDGRGARPGAPPGRPRRARRRPLTAGPTCRRSRRSSTSKTSVEFGGIEPTAWLP